MSSSNAQDRAAKSSGRSYRLGRRAEKQEETRRRIVEAAVDLHSSVGPARTTVSQIAERAGVQRHTFYAHFPDERSLFMACSGLALERDPLPRVEDWARLPPGPERIRTGLEALYGWFARNAEQAACVLRDAEFHPATQEIVALRMAPTFVAAAELLGEGLTERQRALLGLALDFACWRRLSESTSPPAAAQLMSDAVANLPTPAAG
jgi:AcrR family transcriptional regulator